MNNNNIEDEKFHHYGTINKPHRGNVICAT